MNPGETSLPRAEIVTSTAPAYGPPAWRILSASTTTLPRSWTSWLLPLYATTQPPSMSVFMRRPPLMAGHHTSWTTGASTGPLNPRTLTGPGVNPGPARSRLTRGVFGARGLREVDAGGRVGLERTPETELLADVAQRGQHFLAEETDARLRVRVGDEAVGRPEAHDRRPRLFEQPPQLRDHRLRRARHDLLVADLVLERGAARVGAPPHRILHEGRAVRRREVARRARPHRMRQAGELALHPHELSRVGHRLLFGLGHVAALQIAAVLGAAGVADLLGHLVVRFPDLLGRLDLGAQRDVWIALPGGPDDRLLAEHAGNPVAWVRRLQRHRPWVHHAVLVVRALPAERPGLGPRLDDQRMGLLEALAVVGGIDAGGELLLAAAAHEAGDEAPARDHVDHRQLFGEPHGVVGERQRVAEQHELHALGHGGQDRGEHVALGLHAERRVVVLVQHDPVEADLLGQPVVLEVLVVEAAARDRIEVLVAEHQRGGAEVAPLLLGIRRHRLLGEIHAVHRISPSCLVHESGDAMGQLAGLFHVH